LSTIKHTINLKLLAVSDVEDEREEGKEGMYTTYSQKEREDYFSIKEGERTVKREGKGERKENRVYSNSQREFGWCNG